MQAWASAGIPVGDEWQTTLTRRLGRAVFVSLVLHVGVLALLMWVRLPRQGERPLSSIEISLASLPSLQTKAAEPVKSPPVKKEAERQKAVDKPKPVEQSQHVEPPKPIVPPKPVEAPKPIDQPKVVTPSQVIEAPKPASPVNPAPAPPVPSARRSNDIMQDVLKDIELPPEAPKLGDISPAESPKKAPTLKLPDVPVVAETQDSERVEKQVRPSSSSLTDEFAQELDEELKKIKKLELPKQTPQPTPPAEATAKPLPRVEAKAPSVKAVDTTLKVPGMAPGSSAYLARVRQRISSVWTAPPVDVTSQVYVVVVQFRLHRNGKVTGESIEQSSGNEYYDLAGIRAVKNAIPLPPFPAEITEPYFDAHFTFTVGEPEG